MVGASFAPLDDLSEETVVIVAVVGGDSVSVVLGYGVEVTITDAPSAGTVDAVGGGGFQYTPPAVESAQASDR